MKTIAKAKGILAHHFHGDYWATIGLEFANSEEALAAKTVLGDKCKYAASKTKSAEAHLLIWNGNSEDLNAFKTVLGTFGADVNKIDSLAKSVDYGEPFEVAIPVEIAGPEQMEIDWEEMKRR
jgi:hypothetical protein